MAQTTGAISSKDYKLEGGVNGSSWEDYSGVSFKATFPGKERATSEKHTAEGDTPIVLAGKMSAQKVTVEFLYTEVSSELYSDLLTAHDAGTAWYWRASPKGGQSTEFQFTTGAGFIEHLDTPPMDEDNSAAPITISVTTIHPTNTKSAAA